MRWVLIACTCFLCTIIFLLAGCSTISIATPEGYQASYVRIGSQEISGLSYSRDGNSTVLGLERQRSDTKAIELIKSILGAPQ